MQAAAEQEEKIVALIAEQEATLREITRLRKGKGSGRPKREGLAGTDRHKRAAHELGRLKRDLLPGEPDGEAARTQEQLCAAVCPTSCRRSRRCWKRHTRPSRAAP